MNPNQEQNVTPSNAPITNSVPNLAPLPIVEDAPSEEDVAALKVIEAIEAEDNDVSLPKPAEGEPDFASVPTIDEIQSETIENDVVPAQGFEAVRQQQLEAPIDTVIEADPTVAGVLSTEPVPLVAPPVVKQKRSFKKPIIISIFLLLLIGASVAAYLKVQSLEPGEANTKYTDLTGGDLPGGNTTSNTVNVQTTVQNNSKSK
jgi:hypothetical protein